MLDDAASLKVFLLLLRWATLPQPLTPTAFDAPPIPAASSRGRGRASHGAKEVRTRWRDESTSQPPRGGGRCASYHPSPSPCCLSSSPATSFALSSASSPSTPPRRPRCPALARRRPAPNLEPWWHGRGEEETSEEARPAAWGNGEEAAAVGIGERGLGFSWCGTRGLGKQVNAA
uniref:Uncharacterized protein n=2 Tax=Aegilops tauschii subsp. strangulata TaxID=200361 RepID=A0A453KTY9_AEGTS